MLILLVSACSQATWCERFNLACDLDGDPEWPEVVDEDGDVWTVPDDCDDLDPDIHPSAEEVCDGVDNDCDLEIDEGTPGMQTWYYDEDLDGYGVGTNTIVSCDWPPGYTPTSGDCDDRSAAVNPGRTEICDNGRDDDCDGTANQCGLESELGEDDVDRVLWQAEGGVALGTSLAVAGPTASSRTLLLGDAWWTERGGAWGLDGASLASPAITGSVGRLPFYVRTRATGSELGTSIAATVASSGAAAFAVGAPGATLDEEGEGAVVITWDHQPTIETLRTGSALLVGAGPGRRLGAALADAGDTSGDGLPDLLVGAPGDQDGGGAVALFLPPLDDTVELGDAALWLRDAPEGAALGRVLAAGDLDGDGLGELVMGLPTADAVYVAFAPHDSGVLPLDSVSVRVDGMTGGDELGAAVAVAGDLDGDGRDDLAIGAPGASDDSGAVYVFLGGQTMGSRAGRVVADQADARLDGTAAGDRAGTALAGGLDVDGDEVADLLVGAAGVLDAEGEHTTGAVYVLTRSLVGNLTLSIADGIVDGSADSGVGGPQTVHLVPDVNGNDLAELALGAPGLEESALWFFLPQGP